MKLVPLAHATLNRIGSASSAWMASHREVHITREVADESAETLRELVLTIAEEHGESRAALQGYALREFLELYATAKRGGFQHSRTQRSIRPPYAVCSAHPALKIGNRYFQAGSFERKRSGASLAAGTAKVITTYIY